MPSTPAPSALRDRNHRRFLLRKLHSLSGVVPLGVFLVLHLFTNARAIVSEASYQSAVHDLSGLPYLFFIEMFGVMLPLLFHGGYGVVLAFEGKSNVGAYPQNRNWMYAAQRVTGILAFAFIAWHLSQFWVPKLTGEMAPDQFHQELTKKLSTPTSGLPLTALGYVFGVAACVFHFANGLWGFMTSWGITPTRRSQRLATTLCWLVGVAVLVLGASTAIFFATGSRLDVFTPGERSRFDSHTGTPILPPQPQPQPNQPSSPGPNGAANPIPQTPPAVPK